jgi:hypothetical protein
MEGKPSHSSRDKTENGSSRFSRNHPSNLLHLTDWIIRP